MNERSISGLNRDDWITVEEAMELTCRSRRTIYRWLEPPLKSNINGTRTTTIRVWRPLRRNYLYKPDVLRAEAEATQNIGRSKPPAAENPMRNKWVIYYIRFGDRIKIGSSRDVAKRLKNLPWDEVLAFEAGLPSEERRRHRMFDEARIDGQREWFRADHQPLLDHIERQRNLNGDPIAIVGGIGVLRGRAA